MGYITISCIPSTMDHRWLVEKPKKKLPIGPKEARNSISAFVTDAAWTAISVTLPGGSYLYKYFFFLIYLLFYTKSLEVLLLTKT